MRIRKARVGDVTMRMLAPTLHGEFQLVIEISGKLEKFQPIQAQLLLLSGSKSPAYLRDSVGALEKVFPQAKKVVFPGLGHGAAHRGIPIERPSGAGCPSTAGILPLTAA